MSRLRVAGRPPHGSAAVPLALGSLGIAGSVSLSLGSLTMPGPGMWPFVISVCLVVASLPLLLTGLGGAGLERFGTQGLAVLAGAVSVAIFVVMFQLAGMILPGFALLLFWLRYLGNERWPTSIATAALVPIALYVVFDVLLDVPLPDDVIAFWS